MNYNNQKSQSPPTTIEQLRQLADRLNVTINAKQDVSILAEPVHIGEMVIPNSLAIHPMEAADGDSHGRPGELTFRRYERFAAGGAGLIWAEATAVAPEARANPRQLWLSNQSKEGFAEMVNIMRKAAAQSMGPDHNPVIVLQLTHSGRYSNPQGTPHPLIRQRDPYRDTIGAQSQPDPNAKSGLPDDWPILTDEYLDGVIDAYVKTAKLAFEAGFDAVDIKSCHGYLVNELLTCHSRKGKYSGSFENRTRFLLNVIDAIGDELDRDKSVVTRLNVYDAVPYPFGWGVDKEDYTRPDLTEPRKLIAALAERGVKMINVTVGDPHYNPHYSRPFNQPVAGGYSAPEHPLVGVARLTALAGEIQKEFEDIAVVGTGYSWLGPLMPNVAAACKAGGLASIVGVGRMALAYPDFAKDIIRKGRLDRRRLCTACSKCSQLMIDGAVIGCVLRDKEVYGPIYKSCRMRAR